MRDKVFELIELARKVGLAEFETDNPKFNETLFNQFCPINLHRYTMYLYEDDIFILTAGELRCIGNRDMIIKSLRYAR